MPASSSPTVVRASLEGHLDPRSLEQMTRDVDSRMADGSEGLLLDCSKMVSYDHEAREAFVAWVRARLRGGARVAIITHHPLWGMVIATMSLASGVPMRAFRDTSEAEAWLTRE